MQTLELRRARVPKVFLFQDVGRALVDFYVHNCKSLFLLLTRQQKGCRLEYVHYHEDGIFLDYNASKWIESIVPGPHIRIPLDSILVGITGRERVTQGLLALTHFHFIFRQMLPSSSFLITKEKVCERGISTPSELHRSSLVSSDSDSDGSDDSYDHVYNYEYYDYNEG